MSRKWQSFCDADGAAFRGDGSAGDESKRMVVMACSLVAM